MFNTMKPSFFFSKIPIGNASNDPLSPIPIPLTVIHTFPRETLHRDTDMRNAYHEKCHRGENVDAQLHYFHNRLLQGDSASGEMLIQHYAIKGDHMQAMRYRVATAALELKQGQWDSHVIKARNTLTNLLYSDHNTRPVFEMAIAHIVHFSKQGRQAPLAILETVIQHSSAQKANDVNNLYRGASGTDAQFRQFKSMIERKADHTLPEDSLAVEAATPMSFSA